MTKAFIGLGANQGDPVENLKAALDCISLFDRAGRL